MKHIEINLAQQQLSLFNGANLHLSYSISTALNGAGETEGSECTPRGQHRIAAKIGGGLPVCAVLKGRRFTGEICSSELLAAEPNRDWILSRILWLEGCELGKNRGQGDGASVDSMRRYIYIHGTPDSEPMGRPKSHGCVRMRNQDVIELYEQIAPGTPVNIKEN